MRAKTVFSKHCDSVLQKTAKLRSLMVDLQRNYALDETAQLQLATMAMFGLAGSYSLKGQLFDLYTVSSWRVRHHIYLKKSVLILVRNSLHGPKPTRSHSALHTAKPPPRSVEQLKEDLKTLDDEYNKLSEHIAKGEQEEFSKKSLRYISQKDTRCPNLPVVT